MIAAEGDHRVIVVNQLLGTAEESIVVFLRPPVVQRAGRVKLSAVGVEGVGNLVSDHAADAGVKLFRAHVLPIEGAAKDAAEDVDGVILRVITGIGVQRVKLPELMVDLCIEQAQVVGPIKVANGRHGVVKAQSFQAQAAVILPLLGVHGVDGDRVQLLHRFFTGFGREPFLFGQHLAVVVDSLPADACDVLLHLGCVVSGEEGAVHRRHQGAAHQLESHFLIRCGASASVCRVTEGNRDLIAVPIQSGHIVQGSAYNQIVLQILQTLRRVNRIQFFKIRRFRHNAALRRAVAPGFHNVGQGEALAEGVGLLRLHLIVDLLDIVRRHALGGAHDPAGKLGIQRQRAVQHLRRLFFGIAELRQHLCRRFPVCRLIALTHLGAFGIFRRVTQQQAHGVDREQISLRIVEAGAACKGDVLSRMGVLVAEQSRQSVQIRNRTDPVDDLLHRLHPQGVARVPVQEGFVQPLYQSGVVAFQAFIREHGLAHLADLVAHHSEGRFRPVSRTDLGSFRPVVINVEIQVVLRALRPLRHGLHIFAQHIVHPGTSVIQPFAFGKSRRRRRR